MRQLDDGKACEGLALTSTSISTKEKQQNQPGIEPHTA